MDITKMSEADIKRLAMQAAPMGRVAFTAQDVFAVMAAEASKIVEANKAVAMGQPLPDAHLIVAVANRIRDLGMTIATQVNAAPPEASVRANGIIK